jgi:hypothetical protein
MKAWKPHHNIYDDNLIKRHDDNSAINNEGAGQKCAILYTIVENCRRLGIAPRDYLEDVLTRLPGMKANEVAALTPSAWLKVRGGKAKRRVA